MKFIIILKCNYNKNKREVKTMEMMVNEKIIIDDVLFVQKEINRLSGVKILMDKVKTFCEDQENTIFYLDENLKKCNEQNASYSWIDSGYRTLKKEAIFISVISYKDYCCGHFVGTANYLANGVCNRRNGKNKDAIKNNVRKFNQTFQKLCENREIKNLMEDTLYLDVDKISNIIIDKSKEHYPIKKINDILVEEIANEILENLKFPNWKSVEGLKRYLKIIGCRLQQLIEREQKEYYVSNTVGAVVNTGLIDHFGEDYLVYYKIHLSFDGEKSYKPECIIHSRKFYEENGFELCCRKPKPINFFDDNTVFQPEIDSFDLSSYSLNHIVNERNERFPENWQNATENQKVTAIKNAIVFGIKMQERDASFAKTIYSTECKTISWLFPLHLNLDFPDDPELVMVLRKIGKFIEIKTVLPYDNEVKDRITAMSLYRQVW